jgi:23S rRNA (cytidine1920-2'-O)/16S rRNA (cytidine1409-2'-O)-methyltransferase
VSTRRVRVDVALVQRGLVDSADAARVLIDEGVVLANGSVVLTHSRQVAPSDELLVKVVDQFVSRGGIKLDAALTAFNIDVSDQRALDAGSSTGGFTDCLLQRGVAEVVAIDVGKSQMHERVATNHRVVVIDAFNVRQLEDDVLDLPVSLRNEFDLVVADLSFISLKSVSRALTARLSQSGSLVVLVKPQFEATKLEVDKSQGVIADQAIRDRVIGEVNESFADQGWAVHGFIESPIHGAEGNVEYLVWYRFKA